MGVSSRASVNGSRGGSRRFQKSPIQPGCSSCFTFSVVESESPEVCEPRWRRVIFDLRGSSFHCGMNFAAGSSSAIFPSCIATASDMPPTSALASEAVPCLVVAVTLGAYHSQTMRSWRMTRNAFVFLSAILSLMSLQPRRRKALAFRRRHLPLERASAVTGASHAEK